MQNIEILHFTGCFLFIKICWNYFFYKFITSISTSTCTRIPNIIFFTYMFFTHINSYCYFTLDLNFIFLSNLHLHLHICFVNVFDSFIPVIMLSTFRFKSSVLFGTYILFGTYFILFYFISH